MATRASHSWQWCRPLCFAVGVSFLLFFLLSLSHLRGLQADHPQTLPHVLCDPDSMTYKSGSEIWNR